jgi:hypothetical protein
MPTEYTVTTDRPATSVTRSLRKFGLACAASGIAGVAICIVTLSYPAAVPSDRWSYPFDASAQWIVSIVLAVTHLLTLAGIVGVLAARPYGRSRAAVLGLWVAIVGYAGLAVCEVLSGAVGTQRNDSSAANAVSGAYGVTSLLVAAGSIVAGIVIVRRNGLRSIGWSMVLWSGILIVVLVTPASFSGNLVFEMVALTLWSLTLVPLGQALIRARTQRAL